MEVEYGWVVVWWGGGGVQKLCWVVVSFVEVRLHTKFQTTRTIISSRNRVCGWGRWGGGVVNSNNRVKPNLRLRLD